MLSGNLRFCEFLVHNRYRTKVVDSSMDISLQRVFGGSVLFSSERFCVGLSIVTVVALPTKKYKNEKDWQPGSLCTRQPKRSGEEERESEHPRTGAS